jgi:predicted TIM-barrel fold metal-dependent hydrolase
VLIVDGQVHIWLPNTPERPWLPPSPDLPAPHRPEPFTREQLLREMDAAGVTRAVLVTPLWEGVRNDYVLESARAHPQRLGVMGRLDPEAPEWRARLPHWLNDAGMLGLRMLFRPAQRALLADGRTDWVWAEAEKARIPVMVFLPQADMPLIDRIAERHPQLKLVIDHLGLTSGKDAEAFRDLDRVIALARRPNVAVKVSCLPHFTADAYPFRALHPYLRRVYDTFGPKRMFWGTDLSRSPCSYRQNITMFTEEIPWLTDDDKTWIMGRGIGEWIGWK